MKNRAMFTLSVALVEDTYEYVIARPGALYTAGGVQTMAQVHEALDRAFREYDRDVERRERARLDKESSR